MNKLIFKLSSIGYALDCKIAFTNRSPEFIPQDNIMNKVSLLNEDDDIYISPTESWIDYNYLIYVLKQKNIKINFYIMTEPFVDKNLVDMLLPY